MPRTHISGTRHRLPITGYQSQQGVAAVYLMLLILLIVTSSAIAISSVLSRQLRLTERNIDSERAFYAANSGVEEALFLLVQQNEAGGSGVIEVTDGQVPYGDQSASYDARARLIVTEDLQQSLPCIVSSGEYGGEFRRLRIQPGDEEC